MKFKSISFIPQGSNSYRTLAYNGSVNITELSLTEEQYNEQLEIMRQKATNLIEDELTKLMKQSVLKSIKPEEEEELRFIDF